MRALRRIAASLLLGLFLVPGFAGAAQAEVLVHNIGQPDRVPLDLDNFNAAQAFTTGGSSSGYNLSSADLVFDEIGDRNIFSKITATIRSNSDGSPGDVVGTLTNPAYERVTGFGRFTFAAPQGGINLDPNTTYFVVLASTQTLAGNNNLNATPSNNESTASAGWSIADTSLYQIKAVLAFGLDIWAANNDVSLITAINGTANLPLANVYIPGQIIEGGDTDCSIRIRPRPKAPVTVNLDISQTGDFLVTGQDGRKSFSYRAGRPFEAYPGMTEDDAVDEPDGTVTCALVDGEGYRLPSVAAATVKVIDNDPTEVSLARASGNTGSLTEGGSGKVEFTVTLGRALVAGERIDVPLSIAGSGIATTDFTLGKKSGQSLNTGVSILSGATLSPTISFAGVGAETATLEISALQDNTADDAETLSVSLDTNTVFDADTDTNVGGGANPGSGNSFDVVVNDATLPVITIAPDTSSVTEGTAAEFTVTATPAPATDITVNLTVADDDTSDFVAGDDEGMKEVTITAGSSSVTYTVDTVGDSADEDNGPVMVTVETGSGYTVGSTSSATIRVNDDDAQPFVGFRTDVVTVAEGVGTVDLVIELSEASGKPVTLTWSTGGFGTTATAGSDFVERRRVPVTFAPGETEKMASVAITDDALDEIDEWIDVQMFSPQNARPDTLLTMVRIIDNDPTVVNLARVGSGAVNEGDTVEFTVTLSRALVGGETIDVPLSIGGTGVTIGDWSLAEKAGDSLNTGVGLSGEGTATPKLSFSGAGAEVATLELLASGDNTAEGSGSETFTVALGPDGTGANGFDSFSGTTVGGGANPGSGNSFDVVVNDATLPVVSIEGGTAVTEGTAAEFTVRSDAPAPSGGLTVTLAVLDEGPGDFVAGADEGGKTVTIAATETTATYRVDTVPDSTDEPNSAIRVTVGPGTGYTASSSAAQATVEVTDDDATIVNLAGLETGAVTENDRVEFVVTLSRTLVAGEVIDVPLSIGGAGVTIADWSLSMKSGSGLNTGVSLTGEDTAIPQVTFSGGGAEFSILVLEARADNVAENGSEILTVALGPDGTGANGFDNTNLATNVGGGANPGSGNSFDVVVNDATLPVITIAPDTSSVTEGTAAEFTVTATPAPATDITVNLTVADDDTSDFVAGDDEGMKEVTITAGSSSVTYTVDTVGDSADEDNGPVMVTVETGSGYTVGSTSSATIRVNDDDAQPFVGFRTDVVTVAEGVGTVDLVIELSEASGKPVTLTWSTGGFGTTATAGSDFVERRRVPVTFAPGETEKMASVAITDDALDEIDEWIDVQMFSPQNARPDTLLTMVRIIDNDPTVVNLARVGSGAVNEGDTVEFTVTLSRALVGGEAIDVPLSIGGTGVTIGDWSLAEKAGDSLNTGVGLSGEGTATPKLSFSGAGAEVATLELLANGDNTAEGSGSETFTVALGPDGTGANGFDNTNLATNVGGGANPGSGNSFDVVVNDATLPVITIAPDTSSVTEGTAAEFTVTATPAPATDITVNLTVADDDTSDFVAGDDEGMKEVTITAGSSSVTYTVDTVGDSADEDNGPVMVTVETGSGYTVGSTSSATIRVNDDDAQPFVGFRTDVVTVAEGVGTVDLVIELSEASGKPVTLTWSTGGFGTTATAGSDFVERRRVPVTFAPGETEKMASVAITDDALDEIDEWIDVQMFSPQNARPDTLLTMVRIIDNDPTVVNLARVGSGAVNEGDTVEFTVTLSRALVGGEAIDVPLSIGGTDVTIGDWSLATKSGQSLNTGVGLSGEGTATPKLSFSGTGAEVATLELLASGDNTAEGSGSETFTVALGPDGTGANGFDSFSGTTVGGGANPGSGNSFDVVVNDATLPVITIAPDTSSVTEGTAAEFTVTATPAPATDITVNLTVADDDTSDFVAGDDEGMKEVTITAGSSSVTYTVDTVGDSADEDNGPVMVTVETGSGYTVGSTSSATIRVNDDDAQPFVGFRTDVVTVAEGVGTVDLVIELSEASGKPVTLTWSTGGFGTTATAGSDFVERRRVPVTFAPGETEKMASVAITDDALDEIDEWIDVQMFSPQNARPDTLLTMVRIIDNDPTVVNLARVGSGAVNEGDTVEFTVTLSRALVGGETIDVPLSIGGTGVTIGDWDLAEKAGDSLNTGVGLSGEGTATPKLSFSGAGAEVATLELLANGDNTAEGSGSETFTVALGPDGTGANGFDSFSGTNVGGGANPGSGNSFDVVVNDATLPVITIAPDTSSVTEGTAAEFTVTATPAPATDITVNLTVADDDTSDFVAEDDKGMKEVTITAGSSSVTYTVDTVGDSTDEDNGPVMVTVETGSGYTVGSTSSATIRVNDDDAQPFVGFRTDVVTVAEGVGTVDLVIELSEASGKPVTLTWSTGGFGTTATAGSDFVERRRVSVTFAPGETEKMASVAITDDALDEIDEWIDVRMFSPQNARLNILLTMVRIIDNDPTVVNLARVGSGAVNEGDTVEFTVTLSRALVGGETIDVPLSIGGTGVTIGDWDLAEKAGDSLNTGVGLSGEMTTTPRVTFSGAGAEVATLELLASVDNTAEIGGSETFTVALGPDGTGTNGFDRSGLGTTVGGGANPGSGNSFDVQVNDARLSVVTISGDTTVTEGANAPVMLSIMPPPDNDSGPILVTATVADDATSDFIAPENEGLVEFLIPIGVIRALNIVQTRVNGVDEPDGVVTITLNTPSSQSAFAFGDSTSHEITVHDADPTVVSLARIGTEAVDEGGTVEFTVMLGRALVAGEVIDVPLSIGGTGVTIGDWSLAEKAGDSLNTGVSLSGADTATPKLTFSGGGAQVATLELVASVDNTAEGGGSETFTIALGPDGTGANGFDNTNLATNVGGGADPGTSKSFDVVVNDVLIPEVSFQAESLMLQPRGENLNRSLLVTATPVPPGAFVDIIVNIAEDGPGDFLDEADEGTQRVSLPIFNGAVTGGINFEPVEDGTDEPNGQVRVTIIPDAGVYTVSPTGGVSTAIIEDNDPTIVSLARAGSGAVTENDTVEFTVTLGRALVAGEVIDVPLSIGGTGVTIGDWSLATKSGQSLNTGVSLSGADTATPKLTFSGAGSEVATLELLASADNTAEGGGSETFMIALGPDGTGPNGFDNTNLATNVGGGADPGTSKSFDVVVNDATLPVVSITGGTAVTEGGDAIFQLTASPVPTNTITVTLNVADHATSDFVAGDDENTQTVTIGTDGMGTYTVDTVDDSTDEADGAVSVSVVRGTHNAVSSAAGMASVEVTDNDATPVVLTTQDVTATEGDASDTASLTLTLGRALEADEVLTVPLGFAGGTVGTDFTLALSGSPRGVGFNAGTSTVTFTGGDPVSATVATVLVTAPQDDDAVAETVTVSIPATSSGAAPVLGATGLSGGASGSRVGAGGITLADDDMPGLVLSATSLEVTEGGRSRTYTVGLATRPTEIVRVRLTSSAPDKATVHALGYPSAHTLLWDPRSWTGVLRVEVRGLEDDDLYDEAVQIIHTVSSDDPQYGTLAVDPVEVTVRDVPEISIEGGTGVTEGTAAEFTVTATPAPAADITVNLTVADDDTNDFVATGNEGRKTVTIGTSGTATYRVATVNGGTDADEPNGAVSVTLRASAGIYTISPTERTASVDVEDDDPTEVSLARVGSGAVNEGDTVEFTVTLSRALVGGEAIDVPLSIGGTDVTIGDWSLATKSGQSLNTGVGLSGEGTATPKLSFSGTGAEVATLELLASGDNTAEGSGSETFTVALGPDGTGANGFDSFSGTTVGGGANPGSGNSFDVVVNDATLPVITIAPDTSSVTEGTAAEFTVTATPAPATDITVNLTVADDDTSDFVAGDDEGMKEVTITAGSSSVTYTVDTVGDSADEDNGPVMVTVETGSGYTVGSTSSATIRVNDDDAQPFVGFRTDVVTVAEGVGTVDLVIELSEASGKPVTLTWSTGGFGTTATAGSDFVERRRVPVTFAPGETEKMASVAITDDALDEIDEWIDVQMFSPQNARPDTLLTMVRIIDNDPTVVNLARVGSGAVNEGDTVEFTVTLSRALVGGETIDVPLSIGGTGVTIGDWDLAEKAGDSLNTGVGLSGEGTATPKLSFSGAGAEVATLELLANGDNTAEGSGSETFTVALGPDGTGANGFDSFSGTNVGGGANPGSGNSFDVVVNDATLPVITIAPDASSVTEGTAAEFTVRSDAPAPSGGLTVTLAVLDEGPGDFVAGADEGGKTVTIAATETTATYRVDTVPDSTDEPNSAIRVTVGPGTGYTASSSAAQATVEVTDDDATPVELGTPDRIATEGDASDTASLTLTLDRGLEAGEVLSVPLAFAGATVGTEFTLALSGSPRGVSFDADTSRVTFRGGDPVSATVATVLVTAPQDDDAMAETVTVSIPASSAGAAPVLAFAGLSGGASGSRVGDGEITLAEDDTVGLVFSPPSVTVGEGASETYTVKLATQPTNTVTVSIGSNNADVTVDTDSVTNGPQTTLSFTTTTWNVAQTVTVAAAADDGTDNEAATLSHTASGGDYGAVTGSVDVTVNDDDTAGVRLSKATLAVAEGGSETYTVVLDTLPSADVTVTVTSGTPGKATVNRSGGAAGASQTLTFTTTTWSEAQVVTVAGVEDADLADETVSISHSASSSDAGYNSIAIDPVEVTVNDDDLPEISITGGTAVTEGGTARFTITATPAPLADITVNLEVADDATSDFVAPGDEGGKTVTIGTSGTATHTVATVNGGTDADEADGAVSVTVAANAGVYTVSSTAATATVDVTDDDATVVSLARVGSGAVNEGDTVEFTVTLSRALAGGEVIDVPLSIGGTGVDIRDWDLAEKAGDNLNTGVSLSGTTTTTPKLTFSGVAAEVATLELEASPDNTAEGGGSGSETFTVALGPDGTGTNGFDVTTLDTTVGGGADPGSGNSFTVVVNDFEFVLVSFAAGSSNVLEGGNAVLEAFVQSGTVPAGGISIPIMVNGGEAQPTDASSADYGTVPASIEIGADGLGSAELAITDDDLDELREIVRFSVGQLPQGVRLSGGVFDTADSRVLILDTDPTPVNLTGGGTITEEDTSSTVTMTVRLSRALTEDPLNSGTMEAATVPLQLASSTGAVLPGTADPHFTVSATGTGVVLTGAATATPTLTFTGDADMTVQEAEVTFTATANGDTDTTPETVTVTFGTLTSSQVEGRIEAGSSTSGTLTIADDDDRPEISITGGTAVTEGGTARFTITATPAPLADITVKLEVADDATSDFVAPGDEGDKTVTIGTSGTATHTVATVNGGTDADEADGAVSVTVAANAGVYTVSSTAATATVEVTDDDATPVELGTPDRIATEGDASDTASLTLTLGRALEAGEVLSVPLAFAGGTVGTEFTLALSGSPRGVGFNAGTSTVTFTGGDPVSATVATVLVTAPQDDDAVAETVTVSIPTGSTGNAPVLTATGLGGGASGSRVGNGEITLAEDDTAELVFSPTSVTVGEGASGTYTVKLATQPTDTVTVSIGSNNADVTVDTNSVTNGPQTTLSFTTTTWNVAQTVTVAAAADDGTDNEAATLSHTASGGDYGAVTGSVDVTVNDDDTAGVRLSKATLAVAEGGSETYTVVLDTLPSADVTVTVTSGTPGKATVNRSGGTAGASQTLIFTTTTWNEAQVVTVAGVEDADLADETVSISHSASSGDAGYNSIAIDPVEVTVNDGDLPEISIAGGTGVTEGGTARFTITATPAPLADITVNLEVADDATSDFVAPGDEGDKTVTIGTSGTATHTVATVNGGTDADEADGAVSVTVAANAGVYTVSSTAATATVEVTDDDATPVELGTPDRIATEGDASDTASLTLTLGRALEAGEVLSVPLAFAGGTVGTEFTLALSGSPRGVGFNAGTSTVTFTGGDPVSATVATVLVTAPQDDDAVAETVTVSIPTGSTGNAPVLTATGLGGGASGSRVGNGEITLAEDDTAGLVFSPTSVTVGEGASGTYTVKLATQPTDTVTVSIGSNNADVTVDTDSVTNGPQTTLSFTTTTWNVAQTVTVAAAADDGTDNEAATLSHTASGGDYGAVTGSVDVTVNDDDTAGVRLSKATLAVAEGGSETYTVVLDTLPSTDVTVTVTSGTPGKATVNRSGGTAGASQTLTFTTTTWNEAQVVTVAGVEDADLADETVSISHSASSSDTGYNSIAIDPVEVTVNDGDLPEISITGGTGVTEGEGARFTITATPAPLADITVNLEVADDATSDFVAPGDEGDKTVTIGTSGTATHTVATVNGGTDADEADGAVSVTVAANAGVYTVSSTAATATVEVTDDDATPVELGTPDRIATEGDASDTASLTLTLGRALEAGEVLSVPLAFAGGTVGTEFTLALSGSPRGVGFNAGTSTVTFTGGDPVSATVATVLVTAPQDDDAVAETVTVSIPTGSTGNAPVLTATGLGGGASGSRVGNGEITLAEDDTAELVFSPTSVTVGEGASGTYTVKLATQPTDTVTVSIGSNNADVTVDTNSVTNGPQTTLSFTTTTWNVAQTVTVAAAADDGTDNEAATLSHTASGGDYGAVTGSVDVTVNDDDTAGVRLSKATLAVAEGGSETYTVVLDTLPSADVTVTVTSGTPGKATVNRSGGTAGASQTLIFTTTTWNEAQVVTVAGVEDADLADETVSISHSASSGDAGYNSIAIDPVEVTVNDGDLPEISIAGGTGVTEGGTARFTITATPAPLADITVNLEVADDATSDFVAPGDEGDKTVTIGTSGTATHTVATVNGGTDADEADGAVSVTVAANAGVYTVSSTAATATVEVTDDDATPVELGTPDRIATEGDASDTASLTLTLGRALEAGEVLSVPLAFAGGTVGTEFTLALSGSPRGVGFNAGTSTVTFTGGDPVSATVATVLVTAPQDDDAVAETVTVSIPTGSTGNAPVLTATGLGGGASGSRVGNGEITLAEDDTAGLVFSPTSVTVGEGASGTYTVKLATQPTDTVTVSIGSNNADVTVDTDSVTNGPQTTLSFTTTTWNVAQTVTVAAAADDGTDNEAATLSHTASGGDYGAVTGSVDVTVNDDDTAGVRLSKATLAVAEGGSETYTVVLDTLPSTDVTVTVTSGTPGKATVNRSGGTAGASQTLTFTTTTWNEAQVVTVAGVEDADLADETVSISHSASSSDTGYNSIAIDPVEVTVNDGDLPEISITGGTGVTEGEGARFTITATPAPLADITVSLSVADDATSDFVAPDDEGGKTVIILAGETTATYTVATQDDDTDEPDGGVTVTVLSDADDPATYSTRAAPGNRATVAVADDDIAGITLTESGDPAGTTVSEDGGTDSYTVVLNSAPTEDVTVTVTSDRPGNATVNRSGGIAGASQTLIFTASDWNAPQTITVTGVNDDIDNAGDERRATITHAARSGDPRYQDLTIAPVEVTVADDDTRNILDAAAEAGLTRFGRTVGEQSVSAVRDRLSASRRSGFTGSFAGQALPSLDWSGDRGAAGAGGGDEPPVAGAGQDNAPEDAGLARSGTGDGTSGRSVAAVPGASGDAVTALRSWLAGPEDAAGDGAGDEVDVRALDTADILPGTSFTLTRETEAGGSLALWGRGAVSGFSGREGDVDLDGDVRSLMLGSDWSREDWTYGLMLSRSHGDIGYRGGAAPGGEIETELTALVPYVGWDVNDRLSAWGTFGFGQGEMRLRPDGGASVRTDIDWQMAAAGLEGALSPDRGLAGARLSWTADALWTRTGSDAVPGLRSLSGETTRLRLGLEGSWERRLASGGALSPRLEMGLRHDGGDAETGFGLEIGGGLDWTDPTRGLLLGLSGRTLALHEDGSFGDWGVSAVLEYDPTPETKRGFAARLSHDLGGTSSGGMQALLGPDSFPGLNETAGGGNWALEAAYGVSRGRGRVGSSYMALSGTEAAEAARLGYRLEPDAPHAGDVSLDFWTEPAVQGSAETGDTNHSLGMDLNWQW